MGQLLRLCTATMAKCFLGCDWGVSITVISCVLLVPFTYFQGIFLKLFIWRCLGPSLTFGIPNTDIAVSEKY